jgi:hypothetical protein
VTAAAVMAASAASASSVSSLFFTLVVHHFTSLLELLGFIHFAHVTFAISPCCFFCTDSRSQPQRSAPPPLTVDMPKHLVLPIRHFQNFWRFCHFASFRLYFTSLLEPLGFNHFVHVTFATLLCIFFSTDTTTASCPPCTHW